MNNTKQITVFLGVLLVALAVSARLFPHPANFAPLGAIALFSGLYLPKKYAFFVPFAGLLLSDLMIGLYHPAMMAAVYGSFALMVYLGIIGSRNKNLSTTAAAVLVGSIAFFLITNAAVWAFGTMYPYTVQGLMQSYYMALPFFRNSLLGDIFYTTVLVGSAEAILRHGSAKLLVKSRQTSH